MIAQKIVAHLANGPLRSIDSVCAVKRRSLFFGPLMVAAIFGAVASAYWPTFSDLLGFGRDADHSTHSALVVLVVLVLIWNLRDELTHLPIRPYLLGLIGLIGLGFIWLSGQLVFTRVITQFAVLAMIPMAVLTLLGFRWLTAMAFPLFMLMFALPVWNPLVPTLVKWSAKFAELGIRASGVPMYRDGAYFVLPSGSWSIADTCSGVAFLSTCLLLGVLYAWTIYHSPIKRIAFIAGSAVIGVVGNWIRVYLTMMIAHVTDNRLLRDDHYTFGWLLFAVFLFVFCWLGWRYRDRDELTVGISEITEDRVGTNYWSSREAGLSRLIAIAVLILATLVIWPLFESSLSVSLDSSKREVAELSPRGGWSRVETSSVEWMPEIKNPSQVSVQSFEKNGQRVNVFLGLYRNEGWDSKLVSVSNQLAGTEKSSAALADRGVALTEVSGIALEAKTGIIIYRAGRILAWHWYWIDGLSTASDPRAKLKQLLVRLRGARVTSGWVAIYTDANESSAVPSKLLQEFMRDMGGSLESALVRTDKQGCPSSHAGC